MAKIALIGDSTLYQDGLGESRIRTLLRHSGHTVVFFYGCIGKPISSADSNGFTTLQNMDQARAAIGEPDAWLINLGSNGHHDGDSLNVGWITAVMNYAAGTPVIWMGISQVTGYDGGASTEATRLHWNDIAQPVVTGFANGNWADWHTYIKAQPAPDSQYWTDGVHMTTAGYAAKNGFITAQINAKVGGVTRTVFDFEVGWDASAVADGTVGTTANLGAQQVTTSRATFRTAAAANLSGSTLGLRIQNASAAAAVARFQPGGGTGASVDNQMAWLFQCSIPSVSGTENDYTGIAGFRHAGGNVALLRWLADGTLTLNDGNGTLVGTLLPAGTNRTVKRWFSVVLNNSTGAYSVRAIAVDGTVINTLSGTRTWSNTSAMGPVQLGVLNSPTFQSTVDIDQVVIGLGENVHIDVPLPSSVVGGSGTSATWSVRAAVAGSSSATWSVRASVGSGMSAAWNVRAAVGGTSTGAAWSTRAAVIGSTSASWSARASVASSSTTTWSVRYSVAGSGSANWEIRAVVAGSGSASWEIRTTVDGTTTATWTTEGASAPVTLTIAGVSWQQSPTITASWR